MSRRYSSSDSSSSDEDDGNFKRKKRINYQNNNNNNNNQKTISFDINNESVDRNYKPLKVFDTNCNKHSNYGPISEQKLLDNKLSKLTKYDDLFDDNIDSNDSFEDNIIVNNINNNKSVINDNKLINNLAQNKPSFNLISNDFCDNNNSNDSTAERHYEKGIDF
jgi:hypothetical protein